MADDSGKVAQLVKLKLEDYFNRQRVESEFDPSGKGVHTTTPLVLELQVSYPQAAEQQMKTKKRNTRQKNPETKQDTQEAQSKGSEPRIKKNSKKETQSRGDGAELSPRVKKNSKIKSRVKGCEIERITKNAQTAMKQVSVSKIHNVHRYRPHLTPAEYVDLGKVAHVSPHVDAILNTEYAWKYAEDNDDREAARKYVQDKNESELKERERQNEERQLTARTDGKESKTPVWLRVQIEPQSNKNNSEESTHGSKEAIGEKVARDVSAEDRETTGQDDDGQDAEERETTGQDEDGQDAVDRETTGQDDDGQDAPGRDVADISTADDTNSTDDKTTVTSHRGGNDARQDNEGVDRGGHDNNRGDDEKETDGEIGELNVGRDKEEKGIDASKDLQQTEEYIRTESMVSLTKIDNI